MGRKKRKKTAPTNNGGAGAKVGAGARRRYDTNVSYGGLYGFPPPAPPAPTPTSIFTHKKGAAPAGRLLSNSIKTSPNYSTTNRAVAAAQRTVYTPGASPATSKLRAVA